MALTIKQLNSDASFLLSFEPIQHADATTRSVPVSQQPFTILLDPWLTGPSNIFHSKFSTTTQKVAPCVSSLAELPAEPDLVIISQPKSDHCNEATLRQLPASGSKTLILAEPASARLIRSWKYFDRDKVRTIEAWRDPRAQASNRRRVLRIPVPAAWPGGRSGEVTVSWIPQKRDLSGVHGAIGITYRPPTSTSGNLADTAAAAPGANGSAVLSPSPVVTDLLLTPPATPVTPARPLAAVPPTSASTTHVHLFPPSPPVSPRSLRSVQSAAVLSQSAETPNAPLQTNQSLLDRYLIACSSSSSSSSSSASTPTQVTAQQQQQRPISLIFSPHGIAYADLSPWATSHLVAEAALPLTALLHCMDSIANPWWLGGNVCWGAHGSGAEMARVLGARVWVSAHDADKRVRGWVTGRLRTRRCEVDEVAGMVLGDGNGDGNENTRQRGRERDSSPSSSSPGAVGYKGHDSQDKDETPRQRRQGEKGPAAPAVRGVLVEKGVEILRLGSGEEVLVTGDGHVLHD